MRNHGIKDVDEDAKHGLVSLESAMFCAHLSHFGTLYNCYQDRDFLRTHEEDLGLLSKTVCFV